MTQPAAPRRPWWAAYHGEDLHPPTCGICGALLSDEPGSGGGSASEPVCDACTRARAFDQTMWELDVSEPDAGLW